LEGLYCRGELLDEGLEIVPHGWRGVGSF
jgi:hypothetical protein